MATVVAAEPSEVLVLGREVFLQFLARHPHAALDLMAVMSRRLRGVDDVLRGCVTRNPNVEETEGSTFGEFLADRVASFGGSWPFIILFGSILVGWVAINVLLLTHRPFDPYPFILLNLVLSTLAALQAPVIMMSQNRQSVKDRLKSDLDYQINLKAELEIAQLHRKMDRLSELLQGHFARDTPRRLGQLLLDSVSTDPAECEPGLSETTYPPQSSVTRVLTVSGRGQYRPRPKQAISTGLGVHSGLTSRLAFRLPIQKGIE